MNDIREELRIKQEDWDYISSAIYTLTCGPKESTLCFLGLMLQSIKIDLSFDLPTAGVFYRKDKKQIMMNVNPYFFRQLTPEVRQAVLLHEIFHPINGHLLRCPKLPDPKKANIAADLAINQFIPNIGGSDLFKPMMISDWDLPPNMTMEWYYENLPQELIDMMKGEGEGEGEGGKSGSKKVGKGQQNKATKPHDTHDWEDAEEGELLDAVEDLVKRTMTKTSTEYSQLPSTIKDLLDHIETRRKVISWKTELKKFIRKNVTGVDKEATRTRPNKRYEYLSPGLKFGQIPKLLILIDTSGSISTEELTLFLGEINEITRVGARNLHIGLWNTELYYSKKYRKHELNKIKDNLKTGGTDFSNCVEFINKMNPDGTIVLTDLYFEDTSKKVNGPILFVSSSDGANTMPTRYNNQRMIKMSPI